MSHWHLISCQMRIGRDCDCAVVVSNDSDLLTPIHIAKTDCRVLVGLVPPRANGSNELKRSANFIKSIRQHNLASAQFAVSFNDAVGTITKPQSW